MAIVLAGIAIVFFRCKYDNIDDLRPLPDVVSFNQHIIPIFNSTCSLSGCHSGVNPPGHLNLSAPYAYNSLFARQEIDTLHPEISVLYIMINSTSNPMPPTGKMDNYSVKLILKWIQQKAKNN
jgi:hypothetical protein